MRIRIFSTWQISGSRTVDHKILSTHTFPKCQHFYVTKNFRWIYFVPYAFGIEGLSDFDACQVSTQLKKRTLLAQRESMWNRSCRTHQRYSNVCAIGCHSSLPSASIGPRFGSHELASPSGRARDADFVQDGRELFSKKQRLRFASSRNHWKRHNLQYRWNRLTLRSAHGLAGNWGHCEQESTIRCSQRTRRRHLSCGRWTQGSIRAQFAVPGRTLRVLRLTALSG